MTNSHIKSRSFVLHISESNLVDELSALRGVDNATRPADQIADCRQPLRVEIGESVGIVCHYFI